MATEVTRTGLCHVVGTTGAWLLLAPVALALTPSLQASAGLLASVPATFVGAVIGAVMLLWAGQRLATLKTADRSHHEAASPLPR